MMKSRLSSQTFGTRCDSLLCWVGVECVLKLLCSFRTRCSRSASVSLRVLLHLQVSQCVQRPVSECSTHLYDIQRSALSSRCLWIRSKSRIQRGISSSGSSTIVWPALSVSKRESPQSACTSSNSFRPGNRCSGSPK